MVIQLTCILKEPVGFPDKPDQMFLQIFTAKFINIVNNVINIVCNVFQIIDHALICQFASRLRRGLKGTALQITLHLRFYCQFLISIGVQDLLF